MRMSGEFDEFIQLDRTFRDLALSEEDGKDAELFRLMRRDKPTQWSDLLEEPRVILLSEAGSGKTEEIRHVCRDLRLNGKRAFFLRIEHLAQDFEASFEEGTPEEFADWVSSGDEGWLLLDSVDEARLKDPKDFERAIRTIGRRLRGVLQQAHIVITSRGEPWSAAASTARQIPAMHQRPRSLMRACFASTQPSLGFVSIRHGSTISIGALSGYLIWRLLANQHSQLTTLSDSMLAAPLPHIRGHQSLAARL